MKKIINFLNKEKLKLFFKSIVKFIKNISDYLKFFILLFIFLYKKITRLLFRLPFLGMLIKPLCFLLENSFGKNTEKLAYHFNVCHSDIKTRRMFLIDLAYRSLIIKKTRTIVTIVGMSVGIGVIVFLISLGYGVERLVINQVASLDEMKVIDVSAGENTSLRLDQNVYKRIKKIKNVKQVIPLVSLVGKIFYKKASTDVVVYSAPSEFFQASRIKLLKGNYYTDNTNFEEKYSFKSDNQGEIAGVFTHFKNKVKYLSTVDQSEVKFNILPEKEVMVWSDCFIGSNLLGYAQRLEKGYYGRQYYGSSFYPYANNGLVGVDDKTKDDVGLWIKGQFPLFQKTFFGDKEILIPVFDKEGRQKWSIGCIPQNDKVKIEEKIDIGGEVLGEATTSAIFNQSSDSAFLINSQEKEATASSFLNETVVVASSEGGIEIVTLQATSSAKIKEKNIKFQEKPTAEALVSLGLLNILNIPANKALKTDLGLSLVLVNNLVPDIGGKVMTEQVKYKIFGVIDDDSSAYLYIPFSDLYKLAVRNLSQIKVLLTDKNDFPKIRKEIETMGFKTSSVVDTVKQIKGVFANVRIVLALIGLVALVVASLGMFNTLTVSLLERTREIGGMKVMGVVSYEIEDLLLAEAMIMSLFGGFGGLFIGFLTGKIISLIVTIIALGTQKQFLDLTYIPLPFILFIILLSFLVGLITGLYPAKRATKISALNALRYE